MHQLASAQVACLVAAWYAQNRHKQNSQIPHVVQLEGERVRNELMTKVLTNDQCRNIIRMSPSAFVELCNLLVKEGGLRPTTRITVEEQVAKSLYLLGHNVTNRALGFFFYRSGETVSRHFHNVLRAIMELEDKFLNQPDGSQVPSEIFNSNRFYPFFKDCVGAIDGTHIRVKVSPIDAPKFRGQKDFPTQNVLAACTFDLKFTYVLAGWEGTASDSRIIKNALTRQECLKIPEGKYYLVDAGFMLKSSLITPYRGERYHLKEYSRNPPRNARELFNLRHSSLRNAIERAFGVVKKRFAIIRSSTEPHYGIETQKQIILCCCILHNYLINVDPDEGLLAEVDAELNNNSEHQEENHSNRDDSDDARRGEFLRDSIAATMWMRKKDLQNPSASKENNQCIWTKVMDDALIDAYLNQHNIGNRVGGTFTTHAFENIVNELKAKFSDKLIDKERIQNRMKHIKRCWFSCYDIFKNGMSGFGWDPITEFFIAEPEVWQQLIEIKPAAAEWKTKPIRNYEKLVQLYGKDRATGQYAETASEMRKRKASIEVENNVGGHNFETIDEVEFMISQQDIHLDNEDAVNMDAQIPTQPSKSQAESFVGSSSKKKSAKKGKVDDENISNAIEHVAQAIMSSTHEMVKSNELPIPEHEGSGVVVIVVLQWNSEVLFLTFFK
ncbi:hypothetical protein ZIOFF_071837 [Zingiber officinale]|uniref:Uncharacterized protein n=1 Tax=Zingiber officinale TaxID=94328 RepID=A0A8J5ENZ1_ZINOF|nr:hypothetical protein ZIOFF_071837 [Zingiber officinale]